MSMAALILFTATMFMGQFALSPSALDKAVKQHAGLSPKAKYHMEAIQLELQQVKSIEQPNIFGLVKELKNMLERARTAQEHRWAAGKAPQNAPEWDYRMSAYDQKQYLLWLSKYSSKGFVADNNRNLFILSLVLALLGGLFYTLPRFLRPAGIQNDGVFHKSLSNRGLWGIIFGFYLIGFYLLLYFYPHYISNWILLLDPVSRFMSGQDASQWFLYGFLYTLVMLVMGFRMYAKYRHDLYQVLRTTSVLFFQLVFAFTIPQVLTLLNQPSVDLKNIWPLDYSFFFDYNIQSKIAGGSFGIFILVWGIFLALVGVPVLTYFYGKRWYCSWVCGCGGLAETLGDPFRQLSDKSVRAWKIERYIINGVLVLAIIMTILVLITFFTGSLSFSYQVREYYGLLISSWFAGVVGTGFYPLMGNRVWCRFGCPLAAYMGIVQRFKSRFRITVNGGQCISCGNCSTYCEQGIDVRWYAQRGQDVVRASCVGCGVCQSVCPRGVLRLETGSSDVETRGEELRVIRITDKGVFLDI